MNTTDEYNFDLDTNVEELRQTISENLYRYRTRLNLTQEKLAEMTGMSLNGIQKIENKHSWFSIDSIVLIAHALKITPAQLLLDSKKEQLIPLDEFSASVGAFINSMTGNTVTITPPPESKKPEYTITNTKRR